MPAPCSNTVWPGGWLVLIMHRPPVPACVVPLSPPHISVGDNKGVLNDTTHKAIPVVHPYEHDCSANPPTTSTNISSTNISRQPTTCGSLHVGQCQHGPCIQALGANWTLMSHTPLKKAHTQHTHGWGNNSSHRMRLPHCA